MLCACSAYLRMRMNVVDNQVRKDGKASDRNCLIRSLKTFVFNLKLQQHHDACCVWAPVLLEYECVHYPELNEDCTPPPPRQILSNMGLRPVSSRAPLQLNASALRAGTDRVYCHTAHMCKEFEVTLRKEFLMPNTGLIKSSAAASSDSSALTHPRVNWAQASTGGRAGKEVLMENTKISTAKKALVKKTTLKLDTDRSQTTRNHRGQNLPFSTVKAMLEWLMESLHHPYPTPEQKDTFASIHPGVNRKQIETW
ncbi:hypothetical protein JKP88DRAFT_252073 [Tribonema minus]|uniref:KN homeodomain domain-containing protein n=1 Tax=Tribonema minus TaxID=303371 RepID=A0A835ZEH6_9STRA|nr:hypothetical protein JKP88DRAFT_252073 [Tribonema minus]